MKKVSLVLFDLDGTLLDSKADIVQAVNHSLVQEGLSSLPSSTIEGFVGHGLSQLIADVLGERFTPELQTRLIQSFWEYYNEHLLDHSTLYPGVLEFLEKTPHLRKAVVTNKPYAFSKKILEGLKVDSYFERLIGGDSLQVQKPSPSFLEPILRDFPDRSQAILVGDSQIDIDCGKGAGILTCAVTYGYRNREELFAARPDFIVDHFTEISKLPLFN